MFAVTVVVLLRRRKAKARVPLTQCAYLAIVYFYAAHGVRSNGGFMFVSAL
jgi:hypothetical protein